MFFSNLSAEDQQLTPAIYTWLDLHFKRVAFLPGVTRRLPAGARDSRFAATFGAHEKDALSPR
jgi:hypothetical protein